MGLIEWIIVTVAVVGVGLLYALKMAPETNEDVENG